MATDRPRRDLPESSVATTEPPRRGRSTERDGAVRVVVDYDLCASTGACQQVCPEVFEVRSDGFLYVLQEHPGPELAAKVIEAQDLCPTAAISVEQ